MNQLNRTVICVLGLLLAFGGLVGVGLVSADSNPQQRADADCVIPESGPWPPCATGGNAPAAPADSGDCAIPESGPWPPCATGGSAPATPPASGGGDCVIPSSGPWPPCATGGGSAPAQPGPVPVEDSAEKTRRYGLGEIRAIMIAQLGNADGDPIDPDECSISINERAEIRLSCRIAETQFGGDIFLVIHVSFSVLNGEPNVNVLSIEFGGQQLDKNDDAELFQAVKDSAEQEMRKQFKADLNYTALISIEIEKNAVVVTYR